MESKSQVIQAVTFSSPIVGGHDFTIEKGHVNSPSQKGHQEVPGQFLFSVFSRGTCDVSSFSFEQPRLRHISPSSVRRGRGGWASMMPRFIFVMGGVQGRDEMPTHFGDGSNNANVYGNLQLLMVMVEVSNMCFRLVSCCCERKNSGSSVPGNPTTRS